MCEPKPTKRRGWMFRKAIGVVAIVAMVMGMGACGESKWADGEAMKQIAAGLEKRFDLRDQQIEEGDEDSHDAFKKAAQVELDNDGYLRSKPFQDLGMQSDVVAYLDHLKASQKTLKDEDSTNWWVKRRERAKMLKKFVNKYNLQVGAKYADDFNMLVTMGEHVKDDAAETANKLLSKARFEKADCDGWYCYEAKVANTTKYTYYDIVRRYTAHTVMEPDANHDEKWVDNQEDQDTCESWYPGEYIFLEAYYESPQDPEHITAKLNGFNIGDPGK
jgi:hypothetical protein